MEWRKKIALVQKALLAQEIDGWLLYDFANSNNLARQFLGIDADAHVTRRIFYWIPQRGKPVKILHKLEPGGLAHLPKSTELFYSSYKDLEQQLCKALDGAKVVAMEYSPYSEIPAISKVDAGTIELVKRACQVDQIVSSGPFLQEFTCVLSKEQLLSHKEAATFLEKLAAEAWKLICASLKAEREITEYEVQQFMLTQMHENGFVTEGAPICAVGPNAADPHYTPTREKSSVIESGKFVMLDLWCKKDRPYTVFGDMTRMGFTGTRNEITARQLKIFETVRDAQEAALQFVEKRFKEGKSVRGCDVDAIARSFIEKAGFGKYFIHRTGHNLYTTTHGPGAHIDSLETYDTRPLILGTCFTIEPGIYIPKEIGVRIEYDVYISEKGKLSIQCGKQEEPWYLN